MKTDRCVRFQFTNQFTAFVSLALVCSAWSTNGIAQTKLVPGAGNSIRKSITPVAKPMRLAPAQQNNADFDYAGIGGTVYATGLGEVTVTMHHCNEFLIVWALPMTVNFVGIAGKEPPIGSSDKFKAKGAVAGMVAKDVPLGSNRAHKTTHLGKLERGEILLTCKTGPYGGGFMTGDGLVFSGDGSRNSDRKPRTRVREISPGVVEVYFEGTIDEAAIPDTIEQHWYKDVKLTFTGAVTSDPGMIAILDKTNDPDPKMKQAARDALKAGAPHIARMANWR